MPNGIVLRRNEEEADLVAAARRHDEFAIRTLIQQHNHMLFRLERSVLRDDRLNLRAVPRSGSSALPHRGGS